MKKEKVYIYIALIVLGIISIAVGTLVMKNNDYLVGFGGGIIGVSLIILLKYARLAKNKEMMKEYETAMNEERTIFIVHRARSITFFISILGIALAQVIASIFNNDLLADVLGFIVCFELIVYLIAFIYCKKKY